MDKTLVGVDLGGTNIRAAVATGPVTHGQPFDCRTPAKDGPDAVLDAIAGAVKEAAGGSSVDGVAIGIPGPLNPSTGIIFAAPHLPGWENLNAADELSKRVDAPVAIHNDASLAGYAEWVAGAGRNSNHMIFITVSTGIGGGLVINGELVSGFAGTAGEVGHFPLDEDDPPCGSGHPGCLEGTASGTGIAKAARKALADGATSSLSSVDAAALDARAVEEAALAGDQLAISLYQHAGHAVGRAIGGLINLLSPEVVIIGGGLINARDLLFKPLHEGVSQIAFAVPYEKCRIVEAELGTDAGLVGAVAWAVKTFG